MQTKPPILVYTDGSCLHKTRGWCGGWAAVIVHHGKVRELSGGENPTTNQRMEMMGVIKALQSIAPGANVYVFTDSQYVKLGISAWIYGWKQRGWMTLAKKPVVNQDLWQLLDAAQDKHMVSWHWVRGHDGDLYNERCDVLAREAAERRWAFSGQYDSSKE